MILRINFKHAISCMCLVLCMGIGTTLQAQAFDWANKMGGTSNDEGNSVTTDANGNIFVMGEVTGAMDLDPGPGTQNYTAAGANDLFVQKLDPNGNLIWAHGFGGSGYDEGLQILIDMAGNCYLGGQFTGTVDFNFGSGVFSMVASGSDDNFILKLSPAGTFIWAKKFGRSGNDGLYNMCLDAAGNLYTTGSIRGSIDLDPGPGVANFSSTGNGDIYVQKLDANGDFLWAKVVHGTQDDAALGIAVNGQGDVILTGYFQNTIDFDPGTGTNYISSKGDVDLFILKLTSAGNFVWAKSIGSSADDEMGMSIAVDPSGNLLLTGYFSGTTDFNPNSGVNNLTAGAAQDMFVLKLDANGSYQWAHGFGGGSLEWGGTVRADALGDIYVTGKFWGTVDFDPGPGTLNFTATSSLGSVLLKFKANGLLDWGLQIPGQIPLFRNDLALDQDGNILVTGKFIGTSDFDPGTGVQNISSTGGYDAYLLKLGSSLPCTATNTSISPTVCGNYIAPDSQVYTSSGSYTAILANSGGCDSVISINLTVNQASSGTDTQTACGPYTWINGVTYTSSNTSAAQTLTNAQGCDSVVTLNLTINQASSGTDTQTACGPYTWINGVTYTSSNTSAAQTLTNAQGCDSVVTLNLTISQASSSSDTQTACGSYTWGDGVTYTSSNTSATQILTNAQGCDSVVTLNLTVNQPSTGTDTQSACGAFIWIDGITYTSNNTTATHILPNAEGCDSVVTLDLTITNLDLSVTNNAPTLTANASGSGVAYQWLDCNNGYSPVVGATNQDFTPLVNGDYAVEISENGCVGTSACSNIVVVSLEQSDWSASLNVYPNPTQGRVKIVLGGTFSAVKLRIFNAVGQMVAESDHLNALEIEANLMGTAGIYFIEIQVDDQLPVMLKVVKK